jgi:hypothetical protein
MGVGDAVPEAWALAAYVAIGSHGKSPSDWESGPGFRPRTPKGKPDASRTSNRGVASSFQRGGVR